MIAITDICDNLPYNLKKTLFVDDFSLFATGSSTGTIERRLQNGIKKLEKWSSETGFTFSESKTVSLHICRKRCPKTAANLSLYNTPINNVSEVKYLGVLLDQSCTWAPHIRQLRIRAFKVLDLLKHLTSKSWGADRISLLRIYIMLLKLMLEYGSEVFSSTADSHLNKIITIQNSALRIATGAFRSSPINSLHAEAGI